MLRGDAKQVCMNQFSSLKAYSQDMKLAAKRVPIHCGNDMCKLCNVNFLVKLCLILYHDEAHEKPASL